ncbi:hypothetical protein [Polluticoccus soli]|uniref:hypothetical protein n=1 Tax=Polluticoccus soli TaxID=3034150 RepID=UPI0023E338A9|nr:hypothetical protein [Flavipsychrobacter sp. JY13-12]
MNQIITRRPPFTFYFSVVVGFCAFLAIGAACLFIFLNEIENNNQETKKYLLLVGPILMIAAAIYTPFRYFKNVPIIKMDDQSLTIGREIYPLNEIETVSLTGKVNFPYVINFRMEGITIQMRDGTKRLVYDDMYTNLWEVKLLLNELVIGNKNHYSVDSNARERTVTTDAISTFKGNALFSLRGIMLWSMLAMFVSIFVKEIASETASVISLVFIGIFCIFWSTFSCWLLHYFQITNNHLIVRNHYWFWEKKLYALKDIAEVTFETEPKQPNSMRIILKDFRTARYRAGSLRDKTWLSLQKALEDHNIKVRNECISDPRTAL